MNDKPAPLGFGFQRNLFGFGMKSALTERAPEPWTKGVHPKEAAVEKRRAAAYCVLVLNKSHFAQEA